MIYTRISDLISGKNVAGVYREYKETQWYSEDQMREYQLNKLQKLISHCYKNVPYYRRVMDERGISPADVISLDILESFPVLTKEIIKENYSDFTPQNIHSIKGVKTSQTGGTTGNILFKKNDANTRSSIWASYKRFTQDWMGIGELDKELILMGGHVLGTNTKDKIKKKIIDLLRNSISFNPYDTSDKNNERILNTLKTKKINSIRSYSQFLYHLAMELDRRGQKFKVRAITTTAEPLLPEHRALFRKVFDAEVFDQYGCGEIGGIAYECNHHNGLHITEERVMVEVNEKNELIVTDLDNYSMPFIRYWNADVVLMSQEDCTCGRKSKLIKQILGRTCDYITGSNGKFLHWAYFWHLFFDSEIAKNRNLRKFQVIQVTLSRLRIRLVCDRLTDNEETILKNNIINRIGTTEIEFSYESDIENSKTGKFRPVINNLL